MTAGEVLDAVHSFPFHPLRESLRIGRFSLEPHILMMRAWPAAV